MATTRKATGTKKTSDPIKDHADEDTFAKDFLVRVDDSSNVPEDVIENNKSSVKLEAEQRGLRVTGEVKLDSQEPQDDRNVKLVYSVPVKSASDTK